MATVQTPTTSGGQPGRASFLAEVHKQLLHKSGTANVIAPYTQTPDEVVDATLAFANICKDDVVFDVGCGDGRLLIAAAKLGARCFGWDIDPKAIEDARVRLAEAGVTDSVQVFCADVFTTQIPWHDASVVLLYLTVQGNLRLRSILLEQLKPGSRIVTGQFNMGELEPTRTGQVSHSGHHSDAAFVPMYLYNITENMPKLDADAEILRTTEVFRRDDAK